jgi:hypothetical protein
MKTASSAEVQDALTLTLSSNRTAWWKGHANGDFARGLRLHQRNAIIASLLLIDFQVFEVSLRNVFDRHLRKYYRPDWFDSDKLTDAQKKSIAAAKNNAAKQWREEGHKDEPDRGKIIVNLSLNFWVSLFVADYTRAKLDKVFANMGTAEALRILKLMRYVRNKLAHHEPVITWDGKRDRKNLEKIMNDFDRILMAICPDTAQWASYYSVARRVIDAKLYSCDQPSEHELRVVIP